MSKKEKVIWYFMYMFGLCIYPLIGFSIYHYVDIYAVSIYIKIGAISTLSMIYLVLIIFLIYTLED